MMRLQYIWLKKYRRLEEKSFNFTDKYCFSMENEVLSYEDHSDRYIEELVDKNMDVSVLVGKNGTGKTTVLQLIKSICCGCKEEGCGDVVIVFENIGVESLKQEKCKRFTVYAKGGVELSKNLAEISEQVKDLSKRFEDETLYVYYSPFLQNAIDNRMSTDLQGEKDISTGFLLKQKEQEVQRKPLKYPFQEYLMDEYRGQITFFLKSRELINEFVINYPEYAEVFPIKNEFLVPENMEDDGKNTYKSEIIEKIENIKGIKEDVTDPDSLIQAIAHRMLLSFLVFLIHPVEQLYKVEIGDLDDSYSVESIKRFYSSIANDGGSVYQKQGNAAVSFLEYLEKNACWETDNIKKTPWKISLEKEPGEGCVLGDLGGFFNHYSETVCGNPYLSFFWPLSSGEMTVLSMMARFYSLGEDVTTHNIQCIRILLDEAETSLHPEWQRCFLNVFQKAMREIFPGKYIQIIIATHSPIILSDVPRQNVVRLKFPDDKEVEFAETFGANIYRLYSGGFFLNNYCGEFARKKIKEIIDPIYKESKKKKTKNKRTYKKTSKYEEAKKKVSLIGDKFIKNELQRMIDKIDRKERGEDVSN